MVRRRLVSAIVMLMSGLVQISGAQQPTSDAKTSCVLVNVLPRGQLLLNGERLPAEDVSEPELAPNERRTIIFMAHPETAIEDFTYAVFDVLEAVGHEGPCMSRGFDPRFVMPESRRDYWLLFGRDAFAILGSREPVLQFRHDKEREPLPLAASERTATLPGEASPHSDEVFIELDDESLRVTVRLEGRDEAIDVSSEESLEKLVPRLSGHVDVYPVPEVPVGPLDRLIRVLAPDQRRTERRAVTVATRRGSETLYLSWTQEDLQYVPAPPATGGGLVTTCYGVLDLGPKQEPLRLPRRKD